VATDRIGKLLHRLPELQVLAPRLRRIANLQTVLAKILPANLASTPLAISDTGELLFYAENGAIAAKLRQIAPRVFMSLQQRGVEVTGIRVQVQVGFRHKPLRQKQILLSSPGRAAIMDLAKRLDNSPLRRALTRMGEGGNAESKNEE
jgi:hypothetical protein